MEDIWENIETGKYGGLGTIHILRHHVRGGGILTQMMTLMMPLRGGHQNDDVLTL